MYLNYMKTFKLIVLCDIQNFYRNFEYSLTVLGKKFKYAIFELIYTQLFLPSIYSIALIK